MEKLRGIFFDQLKQHYSSRKYKEQITLNCAQRCVKNFREDDLSRSETKCLSQCFHKTYRFLAYSNALYSYLVADSEMDHAIIQSTKDEDQVMSEEMEAEEKKLRE